MIITHLDLETWKHIKQLELSFSDGINLLYGRNEIGKSTIIEAIYKAFWGNAAGSGSDYKNLKPWGTDVQAKVQLTFLGKGQHKYRIEKSFPKGMAGLYLNGTKLTESAAKTQQELLKILNISEKTVGLFQLFFVNQGETLNIFHKKDNPLDDHAKSYLKNVIKETAFKEIQDFENKLIEDHDAIFTATNKPKKNSLYAQLLEKEKQFDERLQQLKDKEAAFRENLKQMEAYEKQILALDDSTEKYEADLKQLNHKKERLEGYDKKRILFEPVKKNYEQLLEIENVLEEITPKIPLLWAMREKSLETTELEIKQLEQEKETVQRQIKQMREKKKIIENVRDKKRKFIEIGKQFEQIKSLQKQLLEDKEKLPELFALNKQKYLLEQDETAVRISDYKNKCADLEKQIEKIRAEEDSPESKVKLNCKISSLKNQKIEFQLKKNSGRFESFQTDSTLKFENLQKMVFLYRENISIEVSGTEKEMQEGAGRKIKTEKTLLEQFQKLNKQYLDEIKKLEQKQTELKTNLNELQQEIATYLKEGVDIDRIEVDKDKLQKPLSFWRESLVKALEGFKSKQKQLDKMLQEQSPEAVEKEYLEKEKELNLLTEELKKTEPVDLSEITDEDVDRAVRKENNLSLKLQEKQNDKDILLNIKKPAGISETPKKTGELQSKKPQTIRDELHQLSARLSEIKKQKQQILQQKKVEDFKKEYFKQKDELQNLLTELEKIEPRKITKLGDLQNEIEKNELEKENNTRKKLETEKQKAEISGQVKEYGLFAEDLQTTEYEYQKTLTETRSELVDIFAVELLLQLVAEEKEKAQREIFRPLQQRVMKAFGKLTGGRYQIAIDNELNLDIAAKSLTGEYLSGRNPFLSFGTKEQLSFLLRLAVAEQLSQKEPQVMILDDSFVNSDHFRLSQMMEIMQEKCKDIQFLIFTCKSEEYLKYQDRLHCIDLDQIIKGN